MNDNTEIDIHLLLSERKQIAVIWSIEDVQEVRPDLTDDQAWQVLKEAGNKLDAEDGINWTTLECMADILFPEAESFAGKEA